MSFETTNSTSATGTAAWNDAVAAVEAVSEALRAVLHDVDTSDVAPLATVTQLFGATEPEAREAA